MRRCLSCLQVEESTPTCWAFLVECHGQCWWLGHASCIQMQWQPLWSTSSFWCFQNGEHPPPFQLIWSPVWCQLPAYFSRHLISYISPFHPTGSGQIPFYWNSQRTVILIYLCGILEWVNTLGHLIPASHPAMLTSLCVFLGKPLWQIPPDAHHHTSLSSTELHLQRVHINAHNNERGV